MQSLVKHFLRGLLVVVPVTLTVYIVWLVVSTLDHWLPIESWVNRRLPGAGLVLTVVLITLVGFLAGNFVTRWVFSTMDGVFRRLPFVKLIYTSLRDLTEAFVGDRKRFDTPVRVFLDEDSAVAVLAFLTRRDLSSLGLPDHVAVYFPQSYNFAGNVLVVPRSRVEPLHADSTTVMTFILSGGVSGDLPASAPAAKGS